jgi:hypothetical protein
MSYFVFVNHLVNDREEDEEISSELVDKDNEAVENHRLKGLV